MFRKSFISQIKEHLLSEPLFFPEDFEIESLESNDSAKLLISHLDNKDEYFMADFLFSMDQLQNIDFSKCNIEIEFSPGFYTAKGATTVTKMSDMLIQIDAWIVRLSEEIRLLRTYRITLDLNERMKELESQFKEIPDEYPTTEQINDIKEFIDNIEKELRSQIEALQIDAEEKEHRINELEARYDFLKDKAERSTFRSILRQIVSRTYRFATDPDLPKLIENGKKIAGILNGPISGDDNTTN